MNTNVDKDIVVLKGELAEMMIQIAPEVYRKYVAMVKKGTKILYVKLQKVLCRLMRESLLFYRKLQRELKAYRFEINSSHPCIANKTTDGGKQLTVVWHMDDLMGTCKDGFELTNFSCYLGRIYRPKLSMHTGQKHGFLGVDMEFTQEGTLEVLMFKYLWNVIKKFPEKITGQARIPAAAHLFEIRRDEKETQPLGEEHALAFHHMVAQLLFMVTRARQDIHSLPLE